MLARSKLTRLSGPRSGESVWLEDVPVHVGAAVDEDLVVSEPETAHAVLLQRNGTWVLRDGTSGKGTFLAGVPIREASLRDGDVIQLGTGGPRLRFEEVRPFTAWGAVRGALHGADARWRLARRQLSRRGRWALRAVAVAGLVVVVGLLIRNAVESRREVVRLRESMERAEAELRAFEGRIQEERQRGETERQALADRIQEFREKEASLSTRLGASAGDVGAVRADLELTRARLQSLESERAAGERIIRDYGAGVCLIQGSYAFYDAEHRPLRQRLDDDGQPVRDADGPKLDVEGTGSIYTVDYYGTGFLADKRGVILTNRHVAVPWRDDSRAEDLAAKGYTPRFVLFRAFFPGHNEPFALDEAVQSETADLAALWIDPVRPDIPVLPLDRDGRGAIPGQPVVVVGYPTGLEAILAKADTGVVQSILKRHGRDSERVTELLSEKGLIRPSTTQGHIGDVTSTDIVFDAPTTQGGSGGPIFNKAGRVIAVEYAVLPKFGGTAYGLPVQSAVDLLRKVPKKR